MPRTLARLALMGIAATFACAFLAACGPLLLALERALALTGRVGS